MVTERFPATIFVDLDAIDSNVEVLRDRAGTAETMAIVKANAYGHGRELVSRQLYSSGVRSFGASQLSEALQLRAEIPRDTRIFTWLASPGVSWQDAVDHDLTLGASSIDVLEEQAQVHGVPRIHLKIDTGMSRAGATLADFDQLAQRAAELQAQGKIVVEGLWSHLAEADDPDSDRTDEQMRVFSQADQVLAGHGIDPEYRHMAATAGTLWHPQTHLDMVRVGIGLYGMSPNPAWQSAEELGLKPALNVAAPLVMVKQLDAGSRISYGGTWHTTSKRWVGLVPLGYADGIPRSASNGAPVVVAGHESRIVGRVCMDQFVIDLGEGTAPMANRGDVVWVMGPKGANVEQWAEKTDTINYEVTTRLARHIPREALR